MTRFWGRLFGINLTTLAVMFWAVVIFTPIVISYTVWNGRKMWGRLSVDEMKSASRPTQFRKRTDVVLHLEPGCPAGVGRDQCHVVRGRTVGK